MDLVLEDNSSSTGDGWSLSDDSTEGSRTDENASDYEDDSDEDIVTKLLNDPASHGAPSMWMSAQEKRWALELKEAIENNPLIQNNLSDMWIAQYALISKGDIANALKRIASTQAFHNEYQVDHSVEQGLLFFAALLDLQPAYVLSLDVDSETLEGLHIIDNSKLNPSAVLQDHRTWKRFIVGHYYYFYSCQPTLATIRNGQYTMCDFGNFDWHNISWELFSRMNEEMLRLYPIQFSKFCGFNTNGLANIMLSMTKRVFPKSLMDKLQLGCKLPMSELEEAPRPLSEIYLQPSREAANHRMLLRAKELLELRAKNDAHFRL